MSKQIKSQPRRSTTRLNNILTVITPFPRCVFLQKLVAESIQQHPPQFSLQNKKNGDHKIPKYRVDNMSPI